MSLGLTARLALMMFLQYFVWGIWLPVMGQHLGPKGINLTSVQIGWVYTVYGFGAILGPFLLGQLADRYLATEVVLALAHGLGGLLLIATGYATSFPMIFGLLFLYCNLYMPTMGLANSLSFRTLGDGHQDRFPAIRLWGTIGWIAAGLFMTGYLEFAPQYDVFQPLFQLVGNPSFRDIFRVAGLVSIVYAGYCLSLPHTPPTRVVAPATATGTTPTPSGEPQRSAIVECLELLRIRSFAVLVAVAGLIGILLAFYFACENAFLESLTIKPERIPSFMAIGQVAEIIVIGLIPLAVQGLGVKRTMLLGIAAWVVRFALSAYGSPTWLMIATIGLHGFAFGFFFVVAQMYVDRAAGPDIKASAQSLLIFIIYGLGTIVGSFLTGYVRKVFELAPNVDDWHKVWAGPAILTVLCLGVFAVLFRDTRLERNAPIEAEPALV